jgi:hypothetical protein
MTAVTYPTRGRSHSRMPSDVLSEVKRSPHHYPTTTIERLVLMATAVVIPLEPYFPAIAGFTIPYFMFAMVAGYSLLNRPTALAKTLSHPVFLAAFCLLMIGSFMESIHPFSSYGEIFRIGQMFVAAVFVASLCRDRRALRVTFYGLLIAGVVASILLFMSTYGALHGATATDFGEASKIRSKVVADAGIKLVSLAGSPVRGAIVALAFGLTTKFAKRSKLLLGIALLCTIAAFLPMSRSAIAMLAVACATVVFLYGVKHMRVLLIATVLGVGVLIWVPDVVFSRMTVTTETAPGREESRTHIYKAALSHLREYIVTGVGAGNFAGPWGRSSHYYKPISHGLGMILGAHNAFIQVTVWWGVAALLALILVVYLTYRCLPPKGEGKDVLVLCLYGVAVTFFLQLMVSHVIGEKDLALGFGLLVGGHRWIWPKHITLVARRRQGRHDRAVEPV